MRDKIAMLNIDEVKTLHYVSPEYFLRLIMPSTLKIQGIFKTVPYTRTLKSFLIRKYAVFHKHFAGGWG
jgi:hypothetical protein